jgi:hypothetical protein
MTNYDKDQPNRNPIKPQISEHVDLEFGIGGRGGVVDDVGLPDGFGGDGFYQEPIRNLDEELNFEATDYGNVPDNLEASPYVDDPSDIPDNLEASPYAAAPSDVDY